MNTITKWRNYKDNGTFLELALISKQWHLSHFLKLKDQIVTMVNANKSVPESNLHHTNDLKPN